MESFVSLLVYAYLIQASVALYRSSLFGGSNKGDTFDDQTYSLTPKVIGFSKILIRSSANGIKGIQATYELEDGEIKTSTYHGGNIGEVNNSIGFPPGMSVVRMEGEMSAEGNTSQQHLTSLTLYVRYPEDLKLGKYGPYGIPGSGKHRFSFAGVIVGLFGQSSEQLDAIGFDIDTTPYSPALPYYDKTSVVGVDIGEPFDDEVESLSPVKITTLTIRYSSLIDGIATTYVLRNGTSVVKGHGALKSATSMSVLSGKRMYDKDITKAITSEDAVIHFADDEWILHIHAGTEGGKGPINSMKITTRDSQGMWKTYGPYGRPLGTDPVTIDGTFSGFYGYASDKINALGFYF